MRQSDVLDNFFKIAQDNGLIDDYSSKKSKKKLESNPRADSLSEKDISNLYNVKPNTPNGNSYKKNIIEDAHPSSVIISPSYDRLNGLVENENERQNITLHILNKTPHGHLTNHKYAKKELVLSLVRIANSLDNCDNEKLRILADTCLMQMNDKTLRKEAITFLGVGLVAIPILLGTLYLQQHLGFINEGFERNHQKLIAELEDIIEDSASWGVGYDYKLDFKSMVGDFRNKLMSFYNIFKKIEPIIKDLEKPRTSQDLIELAKQPHTDTVINAYNTFKTAADNMLPYIITIEKNFSSEGYKAKQIEEKGFLSSLVDKVQFLHGGKGLIADDFDDVVRAITPYKKSIYDMINVLQRAESIQQSAHNKIQDALAEQSRISEDKETKPIEKPTSDIESEIANLEKDLSGGLI